MTNRATLTDEERYFWQKLLVRATHEKLGQPFLSYVMFSLIPVRNNGTKTMGVDLKGRVYVDFDYFMNGYPTPEEGLADATKVLNHEPWHLLRNHHARFDEMPSFDAKNRPRNPKIWNVAGDLTINQDIRKLVPDWGVHVQEPGQFATFPRNLTTEEYYEKIIADMPECCAECGSPQKDKGQKGNEAGNSQGGSGNGDPGDESGEGGVSGDSQDGSGNGESGDSEGSGSDDESGSGGSGNGTTCGSCGENVNAGQCGSGSGGNPIDGELGDAEGIPGLTEHDVDGLRRLTAEEIRKTAQSNPGNIPGGMKIWADEVLAPPTIDWRTVLRGEIRSAISWKNGKMDYNRTRRARRNPIPNVIMPALHAPKARISIGVDVSGSNLGNLGTVLSNVVDISKKGGVRGKELTAFSVDTVATKPHFVYNPLELLKNTRGGGGTDMRVAFEVFGELAKRKQTDICILASDLETGWPKARPNTPNVRYIILAVMNTNSRDSHYQKQAEKTVGQWAKIVYVYPDEI